MPGETSGDREPSARELASVRLMHDAYVRWRDMPPIRLGLTRQDAWVVMMGLQQVVAHPDIAGGPMGARMEAVGRQIQEAVADDPELYAVAEAGWNRAFDVDPSAREEGR